LRLNDLLGGLGGFAGLVVRRFGAAQPNPLTLEEVDLSEMSPGLRPVPKPREDRELRIALALGSLAAGGAERQVSIAAPGLAQRPGTKVSLLTMNPLKGDYAFYLGDVKGRGVQLCSVRAPTRRFRQLVPRELRGTPLGFDIAAFIQEFDKVSPEVVHAWLDDPNIAAGFAACLAGIPRVVLSGRNVNPTHFGFFKPYMKSAYQWLLAQPSVTLINNSHAGARDYAEWLEIEVNQIPVVHNGFDWASISSKHQRDESQPPNSARSTVIAGVMRLAPEKRPLHWLEIASRVIRDHDRFSFVLVGEGPLRSTCEKFIDEHGLGDHIQLLGARKDVYQILEQSDLFMLTSVVEGLPNVLVEAQFLGVPVATTPAGGATETFIDGVSGITLDMFNAQSAARQILAVLEDERWMRTAGSAGREWVVEHFSAECMVAKTLEIYDLLPPSAENVGARSHNDS